MFVSVLTSRYREDEFLRSLPLRVLIGLLTLIISIESMTVAFSMILYLAFGKGERWVLDVVVTAACVPATLFVMFHYSLLTDMIYYWKFPQISGKKGGRPLYTRNPWQITLWKFPQTLVSSLRLHLLSWDIYIVKDGNWQTTWICLVTTNGPLILGNEKNFK